MRNQLLIFFYGVILLIPFLNNGVVLSRHEVLASEPAREMLESNVPLSIQTFAGQYRVDKPPTMSWLIAVSMKVFGSRDEFVCRLPAALLGIIAAMAMGVIGTRLLNPTIGLLSGLITLTTYWLLMQARLAEADMPLTAAVCVAMCGLLLPRNVGVESASTSRATLQSILFYGATGFGFLLKGIAPLITIPAAIVLAIWGKDLWVRKILKNPIGIIVLILFLVVWPVTAYLTYPPILEAWRLHLLGRAMGELKGNDPPLTMAVYIQELFYYLWTIPWMLLPATPVILIGLWNGADRWRTSKAGRFLIAWVVPFLLLLTFSAWKHKHYSLPILPAFSVLAAYGTVLWMQSMRNQLTARNLVITWFVGCALVILYIEKKVLPKFDGYRPQADFAREVSRQLESDQHATLLAMREAHLAFYLDKIPDRVDDVEKLPIGKTLYAITYRPVLDQLPGGTDCAVLAKGPEVRDLDNRKADLVYVRITRSATSASTQPTVESR